MNSNRGGVKAGGACSLDVIESSQRQIELLYGESPELDNSEGVPLVFHYKDIRSALKLLKGSKKFLPLPQRFLEGNLVSARATHTVEEILENCLVEQINLGRITPCFWLVKNRKGIFLMPNCLPGAKREADLVYPVNQAQVLPAIPDAVLWEEVPLKWIDGLDSQARFFKLTITPTELKIE